MEKDSRLCCLQELLCQQPYPPPSLRSEMRQQAGSKTAGEQHAAFLTKRGSLSPDTTVNRTWVCAQSRISPVGELAAF